MDLRNEIKEAFVENKKIFLILLIFFILGFIIAWILADDIAPILIPILKEAMGVDDMNSINAFDIMYHNLSSCVLMFLVSVVFGIFAIFSIFVNGFTIGFLGGYIVKSSSSLILFLALILPHGILEIPALFCSCTSGILLFLFVFRVLKDKINGYSLKEGYNNNKKTLKHSIILFLIAIVLFVIAALIEGIITPQIGNLVSIQLSGQSLF